MKYIIDTDPGIDDSIAIAMAVKHNLDIIGFTLAIGNIPQDKSEKNLKIIQEVLKTDIKMYKGAEEEGIKHKTAEYAHGIAGLGYYIFPDLSMKKYQKMKAENFIVNAAKKYKDDLTLVCFGSLTNLANALKKYKNLTKKLKHVVIMGTSYNPENEVPYKEFNINSDLAAAKLVLEAGFEDVKLVTHEMGGAAVIDKDYVLSLRDSNNYLSRYIGFISEKYIDFSREVEGIDDLVNPDPVTIASVIDDKILSFKPCNVKIIDKGKQKGDCYITLTDESNIMVATEINLKRFNKLFKETFK